MALQTLYTMPGANYATLKSSERQAWVHLCVRVNPNCSRLELSRIRPASALFLNHTGAPRPWSVLLAQ